YINRYADPAKDVEGIRKERKSLILALGRPKRLLLRENRFLLHEKGKQIPNNKINFDKALNWVKAPDGSLIETGLSQENGVLFLDVPEDAGCNGLYLLGSHIDAGEIDVDSDGLMERVHFYPKAIIRQLKKEDAVNSTRNENELFLRVPAIALEIGPLKSSRYIGTIQISHREYRMKVLYRNQPLAETAVKIFTERGWQKTIFTDSQGEFVVSHPESRGEKRNWEKYLYVATLHDHSKRAYHVATLPMIVDPPWPEWRSWQGVFIFWSIAGCAFAAIAAACIAYLKRRKSKMVMVIFDQGKIKRVNQ
ncbi:MAG: hypothetical protein SV775_19850, partial [Thermodesulfobacteriota bacterium]|nr:hypothetical protein [Thermodesulfobacteriota bacterium]